MNTPTFLVTLTLYIAGAIAQLIGAIIKQQPELRPSLEHPGLSEWYVPPKSRNLWAHTLTGLATATGLVSVVAGYLMQ